MSCGDVLGLVHSQITMRLSFPTDLLCKSNDKHQHVLDIPMGNVPQTKKLSGLGLQYKRGS